MYFGLTTGPLIVLGIYAIAVFVMTFFRPKWGLFALIPIIGLGFWHASVLKGGFLIVVSIASLLHWLVTRKQIKVSQEVRWITGALFVFVAWIIIRSFFGFEGFSFWAFWIIKRLGATLLLATLIVVFIKTKKDILTFAGVMVGFATVTALVGILQYVPGLEFFWTAREILGLPPDVAYQIIGKIRITGISTFVIPLSYQLLSLFPIALAWCLARATNREKRRVVLLYFSAVIIFVGLVLTFIKAGIGGAVIGGGVVVAMLARARLVKPVILKCLAGCAVAGIVIAFLVPTLRNNVFRLGDTSFERIPIAVAAMTVIKMHPLGVGYSYYAKVDSIYSEVEEYQGSRAALVQFPHNIILGLGAILGIPAVLIALVFYVLLFKGLWRVARIKDESGHNILQVLAIGLLGSFVAYLVNAMFHNNNPFFGDTFNWLLIGLTLAMINGSRNDTL